ncbi:MAG: prepilin-type N-terminal cleavage/methylation domain-containing protein [Verrucomicrobia bacterium]|nr:MAG: prepilin-type N-terminal cleavage/methylation domain-containing protein [Verrucomicrobiota bacterium]
MHSSSSRRPSGFTLIEMLASITIIVILAGLMVAGMDYVQEKQKRSTAEMQIKLLATACEEFKLDWGFYPGRANNSPTDGRNMSNELFSDLYWDSNRDGVGPLNDSAQRIYLSELDPEHSRQGWIDGKGQAAKILDPWRNEYRYRKGSGAQSPDFDLWSVGKDGKSNPDSLKDKANLDDIRNF